MRITSRTRTIAFFITLGAVLTAVAIFLNVSWIIYHSRSIVPLILGIVFFAAIIAGLVVYVTLLIVNVPYPFLWGVWVALVDFLPMIGGALAGIPTVLFAFGTTSVTAGVVTLVVFLIYTQVENHILNPIVMSRTVKVNPLLVFIAVLIGADIGSWVGGLFGGFVCVLLAIPVAGSIQVVVREIWHATAPEAALPPDPPFELSGDMPTS